MGDHRFPAEAVVARMLQIQARIRDHLRLEVARHLDADSGPSALAHAARTDGPGDTIYGIDEIVEAVLVPECEAWGREIPFLLLAEGLPPEGVACGRGAPVFRLLVDPIDGTRGLMHDKRSGWCLMAAAPDHGDETRLQHVEAAAMVELPHSRQTTSDALWSVRGGAARAQRDDLVAGTASGFALRPSSASDLAHGFATINDFTRRGRVLTARLAEDLLDRVLGAAGDGLDCFPDQYLCCGGQLAELCLGRDRFVLDVRPEVYRTLGIAEGRANHPYDLCTILIAQNAGVVVVDPRTGQAVDAALRIEPQLSFAAYANRALADSIQPVVQELVARYCPVDPAGPPA